MNQKKRTQKALYDRHKAIKQKQEAGEKLTFAERNILNIVSSVKKMQNKEYSGKSKLI